MASLRKTSNTFGNGFGGGCNGFRRTQLTRSGYISYQIRCQLAMNRYRLPHILLALFIGFSLLLMSATASYGADEMTLNLQATAIRPTPTPPPCPAGTIDINGNGRDDGGDDCQDLDIVTQPGTCLPSPDGGRLPSREGQVECFLPLSMGGMALSLGDSVGCLDVLRAPYPRTMVRLQEPTKFTIVGFIPPERLGYPDGAPGSYRIGPLPWTTMGLFLHERWGWWTYDSRGQSAFNTEAVRPAGDRYWYPSLNSIRAYLLFSLNTNSNEVVWSVDKYPGFEYRGGLAGSPIEIRFIQSSFPLPGQQNLYSTYGPSRTGTNTLPAFKVRTRTVWQLYLVVEWDTYGVNGNNEYILTGHEGGTVPVGAPFTSYRVWDGRQSPNNTGQAFCNTADGYVPVPVLEAQAVIRR